MQLSKIKSICFQLTFVFINKIQQFIKLYNFYKKFIKHFDKIVKSLISILKKFEYKKTKRKRRKNTLKNKRLLNQFNDFFISKVYETFIRLKNTFLTIFVFMYFDLNKFIHIKINVFDKTFEIIFC